ncbi:MAG: MurR/RpiR family transcriptional regulator [Acidobacteriota bacterium]|nr:MurR/RpiR family transcriptional regulator [Acidobacteriota bacterium]
MKQKQLTNGENHLAIPPTPLEARFAQARARLSPRRQELLRSILETPDETFYLSSRELAQKYNVDAATIVRVIQALGYDRFAEFMADLRQHFMMRMTPYTIMRTAAQEKRSVADHIRYSLERDLENLDHLRQSLNTAHVEDLARRIHRSRRIMVVGVDFAASLACCLAYGLTALGFDAEAPVGSTGNLQYRVRLLTKHDLLIAISFRRCLRVTVDAVRQAREQGVPTVGITDHSTTPLARYCDTYLLASITSPSFTGSYVAPMGLINAIFVACAHVKPKRSLAALRPTEQDYRSGSRWYYEPRSNETTVKTNQSKRE